MELIKLKYIILFILCSTNILSSSKIINGHIYSEGKPVVGAKCTVYNHADSAVLDSTTTGLDGEFSLSIGNEYKYYATVNVDNSTYFYSSDKFQIPDCITYIYDNSNVSNNSAIPVVIELPRKCQSLFLNMINDDDRKPIHENESRNWVISDLSDLSDLNTTNAYKLICALLPVRYRDSEINTINNNVIKIQINDRFINECGDNLIHVLSQLNISEIESLSIMENDREELDCEIIIGLRLKTI